MSFGDFGSWAFNGAYYEIRGLALRAISQRSKVQPFRRKCQKKRICPSPKPLLHQRFSNPTPMPRPWFRQRWNARLHRRRAVPRSLQLLQWLLQPLLHSSRTKTKCQHERRQPSTAICWSSCDAKRKSYSRSRQLWLWQCITLVRVW